MSDISGTLENRAFFSFLLELGLLDEKNVNYLNQECAYHNEKELVAEISDIFCELRPGDFYDIINRVYAYWKGMALERQSTQKRSPGKEREYDEREESMRSAQITEIEAEKSTVRQGETQGVHRTDYPEFGHQQDMNIEDQQRDSHPAQPSSQRELRASEGETQSQGLKRSQPGSAASSRKELNESQAALNKSRVQPISEEPTDNDVPQASARGRQAETREHRAEIQNKENYDYEGAKPRRKSSSKNRDTLKTQSLVNKDKPYSYSIDVNRNFSPVSYTYREPSGGAQSRIDKLYEDHFVQSEKKLHQWTINRLEEEKECRFTPQVNPVTYASPTLAQTLNTPVFDRLSKKKHLDIRLHQESFAEREMRGVSFEPDLSLTRGRRRDSSSRSLDNESRKALASERLYQKAVEREKRLMIARAKEQNRQQHSYSFSPKVLSPMKSKSEFRRKGLESSVERLHSSGKKEMRDKMILEAEVREKEMKDHPFHPIDMPGSAKKRRSDATRNPNPFERLYEFAKRKNELMRELEQEMTKQDLPKSVKSARAVFDRTRSLQEFLNEEKKGSATKSPGGLIPTVRPFSPTEKREDTESSAFNRLYSDQKEREKKIKQKRDRVLEDGGYTFKPHLYKRIHPKPKQQTTQGQLIRNEEERPQGQQQEEKKTDV